MYCAVRSGFEDIVMFLVEQGADPDIPQSTNSTALHAAAYFGHPDLYKYLLFRGASPCITNNYGQKPFEDAPEYLKKQVRFEDYLFSKACEGDVAYFKANPKIDLNSTNEIGQTLLILATKN